MAASGSVDLFVGGRVGRPAGPHVPARARLPARRRYGAAAGAYRRSRPRSLAGYLEAQTRVADVAVTAGLRYDQFDSRTESVNVSRGAQRTLSPRFAVSTVLKGATVVASYGRFTQAPDYQFLVDAAFDDTTRTGRFRRGNPDLGFEKATQYEFSVRYRPAEAISLRIGVYQKRLEGLVASVPLGVNPDSTIFGNADAGTARGLELLAERELRNGYGFRLAYTLQQAKATSTDPFLLNRLIVVDPSTGDTIRPARAEFPLDFDQRHTLTVIVRGKVARRASAPSSSACDRSRGSRARSSCGRSRAFRSHAIDTLTTDSLVGLPNGSRLPMTVDGRPAGASPAPAGGNHGRDLPRRAQLLESPKRRGGAAGYRRAAARQRRDRPGWRKRPTRRTPRRSRTSRRATAQTADLERRWLPRRAGRNCSRSTSRRRGTSPSRSSPTGHPG